MSIGAGVGGNLLVSLLGAVVIAVITRNLGVANYGIFLTSSNLVSIAMLVTDLGVNSIAGKEMAQDSSRAPEILGHNLGLRLGVSALAVPVVAISCQGMLPMKFSWGFWLMAMSIPFDALRIVAASSYIASLRNYIPSFFATLRQVLFVAGVGVDIWFRGGIAGCFTAFFISTAIAGIAAHLAAQIDVRYRVKVNLAEWLSITRKSISLGIIQIINVLYLKADILILSALSGDVAVSLYGVAYAFITFFATIPSLVMTSMFGLLAKADDQEFARLVRSAIQWMALLGAITCAGICSFGRAALILYAGPQYAAAYHPLVILGFATYISFLNAAIGFASVARNAHKTFWKISLFSLFVNTGGNMIVIPKYGLTGAAMVTLGSELIALALISRKFEALLELEPRLLLRSASPVAAAGISGTMIHFCSVNQAGRIAQLCVGAPLMCATFFVVLVVTKGCPEQMSNVLASTRTRVIRKLFYTPRAKH